MRRSTWTVRLRSGTKEVSVEVVPVVIRAKFEHISNRHGSLVGSGVRGSNEGDFTITLD
jgi:hypothetical protein